jgi:hypothetical protein
LSPAPEEALRVLAARLREEEPISPHVVEAAADPEYGSIAAAGPGSAAAPGEYALVVESVHEARPRLLDGHDDDLALLAGDYLYALGLERLAALGDSRAILELAELIGACARRHVEGREEELPELWRAAAAAIADDTGADQ